METIKCKECERELPVSNFRTTMKGIRCKVCNECTAAKRRQTLTSKRLIMGGGMAHLYKDPEFDDKQPVEVIQMMSRAKRWLDSRGYEITLKGSYTVKKEVKF